MTSVATLADNVRHWVDEHRGEMLDLLRDLVNTESPSHSISGVEQVAEKLAAILASIGLVVHRYQADGFADCIIADGGPPDTERTLIAGHMDTVFEVGKGWPFSVKGERAYGPGVIDMKSGDCVAVFALKALYELGGLPMSVRVFFNSDEEQGSPQSRRAIPRVCDNVSYAFVMEPSEANGDSIVRRKGAGVFTATVRGRGAHAGKDPKTGISAISELAHLILAVEALGLTDGETTINTGVVQGGIAPAVVPDWAQAQYDLRVGSAEEQTRLENAIRRLASLPRNDGAAISIEGFFHRPPMLPLPGTELIKDCVSEAAVALGGQARFGMSGAVSDGNLIVAQGVPTIDGMGPVGGREHSTDEYMELESYFERTARLAIALKLLADRASKDIH